MKKGRQIHVPKTTEQRSSYRRSIQQGVGDSTVRSQRGHDATNSSARERDKSSGSSQSRPKSFKTQIRRHFSENWTTWVVAIATAVAGWVGSHALQLSRLETVVGQHGTDLNKFDDSFRRNEAQDHVQDLSIRELSTNLQNAQSNVSKVEGKLEKLGDQIQGLNHSVDSIKTGSANANRPK